MLWKWKNRRRAEKRGLKHPIEVFDGNIPEVYCEYIRSGKQVREYERGGYTYTIPVTRGCGGIRRRNPSSETSKGFINPQFRNNFAVQIPQRNFYNKDVNAWNAQRLRINNHSTTTIETYPKQNIMKRRKMMMNESQADFTPLTVRSDINPTIMRTKSSVKYTKNVATRVEGQKKCCLLGCSNDSTNRTRFCLKGGEVKMKLGYEKLEMDRICDSCYFKDHYIYNKKQKEEKDQKNYFC